MYNLDSLPPPYYEERLAADRAARQAAHTARLEAHLQHCPAQKSSMPCPQNLTQALLQRPPLSRQVSGGATTGTTVIGGIFQGFVRAASEGRSAAGSGATTPKEGARSPGKEAGRMTREEYDAWTRRRREDERGVMPGFYH